MTEAITQGSKCSNQQQSAMPRRTAREIPRRLVGKQAVKRRGPADPLLGDAWRKWANMIKEHGPLWLYALTVICHALCLRVTEALLLTAESFDWYRHVVTVPALKGQDETEKLIPRQAMDLFRDWWRNGGLHATRSKRQGNRGLVQVHDTWQWPRSGFLFPSTRRDSKLGRMTKD